MKIQLLADNNKYMWNDFVEKSGMGTIFQSVEWGIERKRHKWLNDLLILEEKGDILGGAMVYWKKIPFFDNRIFKIGPVWNNDKDVFDKLCEEIIKTCKELKAIFLEFQPYLPGYINGAMTDKYLYVIDILLSRGFIKMPEKRGTYWINLERNEDEIFKNFEKNHRRDIRKAIRENVEIKIADDPSLADTFYDYYAKMLHSKNLRYVLSLSRDFFLNEFKTLLKNNKCKLFYAEYEGTIYNMAVISLFGNPMYTWGASIRSERKPPMGQLLHWEIIRWLKERNYKIYDLGGSYGAIPQEGHPNYWVWRFKKGFNGDYVEFLPAFRYVFNRGRHWLFEKILPLYRRLYRRYSTINREVE